MIALPQSPTGLIDRRVVSWADRPAGIGVYGTIDAVNTGTGHIRINWDDRPASTVHASDPFLEFADEPGRRNAGAEEVAAAAEVGRGRAGARGRSPRSTTITRPGAPH